MLMAQTTGDKKFEAKVRQSLWDQFEAWAQDRGEYTNGQLLRAFLRLFLSVPEALQLQALFGRGDRIKIQEYLTEVPPTPTDEGQGARGRAGAMVAAAKARSAAPGEKTPGSGKAAG